MLVSAAALALALTSMSLCGCGTLGWKAGPTGAGAMKPHAVAEEATGGGAGWTGVARVTVSALLVALCAFAARRGNESAYYGTAVLLGFIALAASGARMGLASLGLLVALQAICGIAYGYRGQPVVYFITTYVLFDVVAPLNLDMLVGHRLIAGIFRLFLLAGAFVAAQVGFRLEFLTGRSRAATARNILLCAAFLLLLALATSSSLFLDGHRISAGKGSIVSIALVAIWFVPWLGLGMALLDKAQDLVCRKSATGEGGFCLLFAIGLATGLTYLSLYWPGMMSEDSFIQWKQATGVMPLSDWHPYLHTLVLRALIGIYPSPAVLPIAQIVLSAFIYASWGAFLVRRGADRNYVCVLLFLFSISPLHALLNITLWKDVLYTLALAYLTLQFAKLAVYGRGFFGSAYNCGSFVLSTMLAWSMRHNGIAIGAVAVSTLCACLIACKGSGGSGDARRVRNIGLMLSIIVAAAVVIQAVMPAVWHIIPNPRVAKYATLLSPLGAIAQDDLPIDAETSALMNSVMPIEQWKNGYSAYSACDYLWNTDGQHVAETIRPGYFWASNGQYAANTSRLRAKDVLRAYFRNLLLHPRHLMADRMNQTRNLWNMTDITVEMYTLAYTYHEEMNVRKISSYSSAAGRALLEFLKEHNEEVFNLGPYSLLLALLLFYTIVKGRRDLCVAYLPVIANTATLLLAMPAPNYRFGYYLFELAPFLLTFVLVEMRNGETACILPPCAQKCPI